MIRRTSNYWGFWSNWTYGFVILATGLVQVFSFGLLASSWTLDFARWRTRRVFAAQKTLINRLHQAMKDNTCK